MTESMKKRNRLLAERMIKALESRNMEAFYAETKEDTLKKALELIPEGSSISWGGSMSIQEIGLTDAVKSGKYQVYERAAAKNPEEKRKIELQAFDCDFFLASSNAITEDGILVNIDGNANRVAAIAYGPRNVLMIIGMNKVVRGQEEALSRAKYTAAPANAQRFSGTPCTVTGECAHCKSPECICCQTMITRYSKVPKRIMVILENEDLVY